MPNLYEPADVAAPAGHYIAGDHVIDGALGLDVLRPSDGRVHATAPVADAAVVDRAVAASRAAQPGWARLKPRDRGRILQRFAALVEAHAEELARLESVVSSRVQPEAVAIDVATAAEYLRFYGEYCDKLEGVVTATGDEALSLVLREPIGVVGIITPWNFPMILSTWKAAPALAAGNGVVLKPSELTPFSMVRMAELAVEAGVPAGLFNVVLGDGPTTGLALTTHPDVGSVSFTGSSAVGGRIMGDVGRTGLKPLSLELGGKGPQLVFDDCGDLDTVADHIAWGITRNAGQLCYAGSRLIVAESIADDLAARVVARMQALTPGATWEAGATLPPIISRRQADRIARLVDDSVSQGARPLVGGHRFERGGGAYFEPTLLTDVRPGMPAFEEEVFGPVLTLETFRDEAEGVARSQHPRYGLSASVFTADNRRALKAARAIKAGTVWVNRWGRTAEMMTSPFGGFGQSGFGKEAGRLGIEGFTRQKAVWLELADVPDLAHRAGLD
jgi:aldehyde dehydrogenase (NAD+)